MIEVQKGIYRLDGELKSPVGRPIVLVHPWYYGTQADAYETVKLEAGSYLDNLERWLESRKNANIFIFEESLKLGFTSKYLAKIAGSKGRYFILTLPFDPLPAETDFTTVAEFLENFDYDFEFAGGLLYNLSGMRMGGCLGSAMKRLGARGISGKTVEECCFC